MSSKLRIGIIGGAGYTGGELLRLLINHPNAEIAFVNSKSNAGNNISKVHADLIGETDIKFSAEMHDDIDVLFLCVGHGAAKRFLEETPVARKVKIIESFTRL
ncbi:MAG: NAD(P)-binding domain-containing protein [Chitinophagaceae bacterium]